MKILIELSPYELTDELIGYLRKTKPAEPVVIEQPKPVKEAAPVAVEQPKTIKEVDKGTGTIVGSPTPDGELKPVEQPKPVEEPKQQPLLPVAEQKTFTVRDLIAAATAFTRDHPDARENLIALLRDSYKVRSINDLAPEQINEFAMNLREMGAQI